MPFSLLKCLDENNIAKLVVVSIDFSPNLILFQILPTQNIKFFLVILRIVETFLNLPSSGLPMFSWNLENWNASTWKTKTSIAIKQKQPPEVLCKKSILRNFTNFTGKHLCQNTSGQLLRIKLGIFTVSAFPILWAKTMMSSDWNSRNCLTEFK